MILLVAQTRRTNSEKEITESSPESVLTGKTNRDLMQIQIRANLQRKMIKVDNNCH